MKFRIAPTPSGFLHAGNAFNFILTALLAHNAGSLRLRIDDADATRVRPDYIADIFETLRWLNITWQEGPSDPSDHLAHFSQSLRAERYSEVINDLIATGGVFACDCSRKDILAASVDGQYPGTCRDKNLPLDTPDTALRLRTDKSAAIAFTDGLMGRVAGYPYDCARDPIIRRRDGLPAYHIASLADDIDFGITHIVRGIDLLSSTFVQLFIAQKLDLADFGAVAFFHHPLLEDASGAKLSKSAGSDSLHALRMRGEDAEDVYRHFSHFMCWPYEVRNMAETREAFAQFGVDQLRRAMSRP